MVKETAEMTAEYRFKIDGSYTPATLPMGRLAEYVAALARFLGEGTQVHFRGVEAGSAVLVAHVDPPARLKVRDRFDRVRTGLGPKDADKAYADLDKLLRDDNATGLLLTDPLDNVIPFPGRTRPVPMVFGPFWQNGSLTGEVIRVGGKDETMPVNLREAGGEVLTGLYTKSKEIARQLARFLYGPIIRVHGTGKWLRNAEGVWQLEEFKITSIEELDDATLADVVERLRSAKGSQWRERANPVADVLADRHGEDIP